MNSQENEQKPTESDHFEDGAKVDEGAETEEASAKSSDESDKTAGDVDVNEDNHADGSEHESVEPDQSKPDQSEVGYEALSKAELIKELELATQQLSEVKDGFLRAKADVENIRRRSQNEVVSARKYAVEGFAQELLSVKDSLDQAAKVDLDSATEAALPKMKEGLELTSKQLEATFTRFSVTEVEAGPGVKFNPEFHQAISMVPGGEVESDHIVDVMQKGFLLKHRLLRPAMVVVAQ